PRGIQYRVTILSTRVPHAAILLRPLHVLQRGNPPCRTRTGHTVHTGRGLGTTTSPTSQSLARPADSHPAHTSRRDQRPTAVRDRGPAVRAGRSPGPPVSRTADAAPATHGWTPPGRAAHWMPPRHAGGRARRERKTRPWHAAHSGSTSARHRASARPTPCCPRRTAG